ncbi:KLHL1 protein, partial [Nycticryphes semicollaris]|nr:KLHL1 protein [Nycticryphes semicollaris]
MSGSGRKDFDVKHILRLRWKLFSHPSPAGGPAGGGCLPPDSSFEHWGPSQSRLLKSQERGNSVFWKKSASSASSSAATTASPPNGTLLPAGGRPTAGHGLGHGHGPGPPPPRTVFYSLEEEEEAEAVPGGMEVAREPEKPLAAPEREEAPGGCSDGGNRATGDGGGH